jgi:hypothetical protein
VTDDSSDRSKVFAPLYELHGEDWVLPYQECQRKAEGLVAEHADRIGIRASAQTADRPADRGWLCERGVVGDEGDRQGADVPVCRRRRLAVHSHPAAPGARGVGQRLVALEGLAERLGRDALPSLKLAARFLRDEAYKTAVMRKGGAATGPHRAAYALVGTSGLPPRFRVWW